ncbi:MAG: OmpA family protein [Cellvibrionaceae bacterium]|nr:OmpA family protein [Cellvibrionaceae bacterium]MCV6626753.1 OmpA family protein [Cellvibrionaceae bacterium]
MKTYKKKALLLAMGVASSMGTATVLAENHSFETYLGASRHMFDSDRAIGDDNGLNIGLGWVLSENFTLEAVANGFETDEDGNSAIEIDGRHYRLDAVYNLARSGNWQPFLVGGAGDQSFEADGGDKHRETALNFGGGVKYFLSNDWQLRGDLRAIHSMDNEVTDYALGLGVAYLVGGTSAVAAKNDADGDSVEDALDQCPNTPAGVAVDGKGCPIDSDRDGVYDYGDLCPDTPAGATVDSEGCEEKISKTVSTELDVKFDVDKSYVKPQYMSEIKDVADFMKQYDSTNVELAGHTDSTASDAYNQSLSERRANAVAKILVQDYGVDSSRVSATGYGESRPVADNGTVEGRAANRRVVAEISTETTE